MFKQVSLAAAILALVASAAGAQDQKAVAKGRDSTVKHNCSACHAVAGKGGKIGKALDGVGARYDAAALKRILTDPQKEFPDAKVKMPKIAWAEGEMDAVIAYLQSLK